MEDEVLKELKNLTNRCFFLTIEKMVVMKFGLKSTDDISFKYDLKSSNDVPIQYGLKLTKEQSVQFHNWLSSKGFNKIRILDRNEYNRLAMELGYKVVGTDSIDLRKRVVLYEHIDGKKGFIITYIIGDSVTINNIIYVETNY